MNIDKRRRILGATIRKEREQQGISQRSFALMIGVSQPYLSAVERGNKNVGFNNLCKIADGLGVSLTQLIEPLSRNQHE